MQKINLKEVYYNANKFYGNKNFEKAKDLYLKILEFHPGHPQTNNNLGLTYRNLNDVNKAIDCFKVAIKNDEKYVIAINNLAKCLQEINHIEESILFFEKSLKLDPYKKETFEEYSSTLLKCNQHEKALRYLNKGVGTIKFTHKDVSII